MGLGLLFLVLAGQILVLVFPQLPEVDFLLPLTKLQLPLLQFFYHRRDGLLFLQEVVFLPELHH